MREETAIAAMLDRGAAVSDREAETALDRLEAAGDLDPADREAVEALADRLVAGLLAGPVAGIEDGDPEAVAAAMELFGEEGSAPMFADAETVTASD